MGSFEDTRREEEQQIQEDMHSVLFGILRELEKQTKLLEGLK